MKLIHSEIIHLGLSIGTGVLFFSTAGWWGVLGAIGSGFLIDSDHLIDYLLYEKDWRKLSVKKFFSSEHFEKSGKLHLFFHGWEYAVLFLLFGWLGNYWVLAAMSVSNFLHLAVDQITNDVRWNTYFVTYRFRNSWKSECN